MACRHEGPQVVSSGWLSILRGRRISIGPVIDACLSGSFKKALFLRCRAYAAYLQTSRYSCFIISWICCLLLTWSSADILVSASGITVFCRCAEICLKLLNDLYRFLRSPIHLQVIGRERRSFSGCIRKHERKVIGTVTDFSQNAAGVQIFPLYKRGAGFDNLHPFRHSNPVSVSAFDRSGPARSGNRLSVGYR